MAIFLIAISKELFDLDVVMRNQFYLEPFKDILVTTIGATICLVALRTSLKVGLASISSVSLSFENAIDIVGWITLLK